MALVLSARGWSAFAALEIEASIQKLGTELHGRVVHDRAGKLAFHRYGEAGQSIFCVSRTALNAAFLDALDQHAHVGMHFGERLVGVDTKASTLRFQTRDGAEHAVPLGERVLAADGAFSTVRSSYQRTDLFDYSQQYGTYGYKEFTLPPRGGAPVFEANATHVWPRGQSMLTAFPLLDGSFTCTLVMPFQGQQSFASLGNTRDVLDLFEREFPDALVHMPELAHEFAANPTASFVSIRCYPWVHGGVALIGDAAHAMVPFFGQGMNAGFEDAQVLDACLARHDDDWRAALADYQSARKPNCDAVTDLSLLHFSELSDRVADPRFILQKRLEQKIHRMHSDKFVPLYSRVAFTTTPYVEALEARQRQQALIDKLIALPNIESDWDSPAVETAIHRLVLEL